MTALSSIHKTQSDPSAPVRVLIVDDSTVVLSLMQRWLSAIADVEIVGTAGNGHIALDMLTKHDVDIIILDIAMPVMDGLTALPRIRALQPQAQVIISSTLTAHNADISLQALAAGAADYVTKPSGKTVLLNGQDFFDILLEKIRVLGAGVQRKKLRTTLPVRAVLPEKIIPAQKEKTLTLAPMTRDVPLILVIGCSTGGPQALFRLLADLPKPFPLPIVIVQHMPPIFTDILAQQLTRSSGIATSEAKDGQLVLAGHAYLAPGDFHMTLAREGALVRLALTQTPPVNFCRPAVDPLFQSAATLFGPNALALVLTGMGKDGLVGARALAEKSAAIIVQDESTSVVWGMPGAVATAGLAQEVLPLGDMADAIMRRLAGSGG